MFSTQIYTSTFIYIIIFTVLLFIGIINLVNHWKKSDRIFYLRYAGLWLSGLIYNIVEGALPDPQFQIGEMPQNIIAWTIGIAVAFHFLAFLKTEYSIKFQKKDFSLNAIGMIALLLFVILFILPYTITKSIEQSRVFFIAFVLVVLLIGDLFFIKQLFSRYKGEENKLLKIHSVNGMIGLFGLFSLPATILVLGDNQFIEQSLFSLGIFAVTVDYFLYPLRKEQNKSAISFDNLSPRETEILTLILENPDVKYSDMSNQLNISEKTISTHLSNIYKKTNLNNKKDIEQLSKSFRNSITA